MKNNLKTLIVDDEKKARETLEMLVNEYQPEVEIVAQASNIEDAYKVIQMHDLDLIFLDIEMPGGSGIDLLKKLVKDDYKGDVIFTTAYSDYAIEALKLSAFDYLLKPIIVDELQASIDRLIENRKKQELPDLSKLIQNLTPESQKITINDLNGLYILNIDDIIRCSAESNYTNFFLKNGKKITASKTLKEFEQKLGDNFIRVHHADLINLNEVLRFDNREGGYVVMTDGSEVAVSKRKKAQFMEAISNF